MSTTIATPQDVADRLGFTLTSDQSALVQVLLDDVESMIIGRIPNLTDRLAAVPPTIASATVVKVEAWAVVRYMKNPDGKYQESLDDYSFTRDKSIASGDLYISDAEWNELLADESASSAFTIRTDTPNAASPWSALL